MELQMDVPARLAEIAGAARSMQSNVAAGVQCSVNSICNAVNNRVQQCRYNLERRSLRVRYGCPSNRVTLSTGRFAAVIPGDSVAEQIITLSVTNFLNLYNAALIGRLILTWFPSPPEAIVGPLATVCDPYLNLFRGIIPPLGGTIDLSPILAFVALDLFTNAASALPAEVGPDGRSLKAKQRQFRMFNPTAVALAWQKRMAASKQRSQA